MTIQNVNSSTLKKWLENGEAVLVDVRQPAENASAKISGSKLIPLDQICENVIPKLDGKKLVIHCQGGKRSMSACQKLKSQGCDFEIYNLEGGIAAWEKDGNEIEKSSGKKILPLDQQVQLTIGLGVLIGSLLGYFVDPAFCFLAAFFGAGLTFAGLSGFCGLAILMAKMPWNKSADKNAKSCFLSK